jgi:hypothetical protein
MTYDAIRGVLQTGDLVLFSGKGEISSIIKWATKSDKSHVGMVLRIPEYDMVLLWESTTLNNVEDIESGNERKGVQLVPLSERIRKYNGDVTVRRLFNVDVTPAMISDLNKLRQEVKGRPYEQSKIELIRCAYDGPMGQNKEDLSSLFCSELVAEALQRMGLLSEKLPSNEYTPKDFADPTLELLDGFYDEEITIRK